jgi:hypothetical protein
LAAIIAAVAVLRPRFAQAVAGPDEKVTQLPVPAGTPQAPAETDLIGAQACSRRPEK